MDSVEEPLSRAPLVLNRRNFSWLTERISGVVEQPAPREKVRDALGQWHSPEAAGQIAEHMMKAIADQQRVSNRATETAGSPAVQKQFSAIR